MFDGSIGKLKKAPSFMDRTDDGLPPRKEQDFTCTLLGVTKNIKEENSLSPIITVDVKCLEKPRK